MRKTCARLTACILAGLMLFTVVPFAAGAAETSAAVHDAALDQVGSATQNGLSLEEPAAGAFSHVHTQSASVPEDQAFVHTHETAAVEENVHEHSHETAVPENADDRLQKDVATVGQAVTSESTGNTDNVVNADDEARFTVALSSRLRSGGTALIRLKGGGEFEDGSEAAVTAFPKKGFTFVGWFRESDTEFADCLSNQQAYTFTVTEDISLIALYDSSTESVFNVAVTGSRFTVNEGSIQVNSATFPFNAGERVFVSFTDSRMKFLYWENASRNIVSTDKNYSFVLANSIKLNAVYTPAESADTTALVVFRNAYQQILWTHTYSEAYPEPIFFPSVPNKMGYTFREWQLADVDGNPTGVKATDAAIRAAMKGNDEIIVVPVYTAAGENTYSVTVKYVDGDQELLPPVSATGTLGDPKNFTAPEIEGKYFQYWKLNGAVCGYNKVYTLVRGVSDAVVLEAVYGDTEIDNETSIGFTQVFCSRKADNKYVLSHTMQYYIPVDWTMAESGFLYTSDAAVGASEDSMVMTDSSIKRHTIGDTYNRYTYTFNLNTSNPDKVYYIRGYIKYKDASGVLHTEYTPISVHSYNEINSIRYTVKWLNADGTLLDLDSSVPFGTVPEYKGEQPTMPVSNNIIYYFAGWSPEVTAVTGDATYTAKYTEAKRTFTGPQWTWNGISSATASFTADDDPAVVQTVNAQISEVVITPASCTASGQRELTATAVFDGKTYTDSTTAEIAALGHDLIHHDAQAPTADAVGWEAYDACSRCDYTTYVEIPKLPAANVTTEAAKTDVPVYAYNKLDEDPVQILPQLDAVYKFTAVEPEEATAAYYGNWNADYRVVFNNPIKAESFGLYGAYNGYGNEYNVAFLFPADIEANTPVYLLEAAGLGAVTYDDVKNNIKEFICGVFNLNAENNGTQMTVELVIWESGKDDATVLASQSYTFGEAAEINCNHTWGEWVQTKAPACTEKGEMTRTCSRCGEAEHKDVAPLGHDLIHHDAKAATCTEISWNAYDTCSRCDYTTYEEIAALGHDWNNTPVWNWTGTSAATATFTCERNASHTESKTATITSAPGTGNDAGYMVYTATVTFNGQTYTNTKRGEAIAVNTFTHSDNLAHTDTYLYRVGNGNTVSLGTLFRVNGTGTPVANNVKIKVEAVEANSGVRGTGTNLESGSNAKCIYTKNASDWTQSTLKFTGEGPVKVTISEGSGATYTLNLEVVTGKNIVAGGMLDTSTHSVLLGNINYDNRANYISLSSKKVFGNGFTIDLSNVGDGATKTHGILMLYSSSIDNAVIIGPTYTQYEDVHNNSGYASTVCSFSGSNIITNCYISGAASPLKAKTDTFVSNTVLYGGIFNNFDINGGRIVTENLTTVGTGKNFGIVFDSDCSAGSSITINGALTQHNFIADNASMGNSNATTLKSKMFSSEYSEYQFTSGSIKYVNAGIISMSSNVGAAEITDNRTDKKHYSGKTAEFSLLGIKVNGYVYTMDNSDTSMLETSYTQPAYMPNAQSPYDLVFDYTVSSGDAQAAGGDEHCYKDNDKTLQIQFTVGGRKTISPLSYPTLKRYGSSLSAPSSFTVINDSNGAALPISNNTVTFTDKGTYTLSYLYENVYVYDKDLGTATKVNYTKTVKVNVTVKKNAPNATITVNSTTGSMIFGSDGTSTGLNKDFKPYAGVLSILTIKDTNAAGVEYTVLDGSNQRDFLSKITSVVADSDNKTGFTIYLVNGTKLYIKCAAPFNSGTLVFKKNNNQFYMGGSVCYGYNNHKNTTKSWNVTKYQYTGENGVTITVSGTYTFSGVCNSTVSMTALSYASSLVYVLDGGEMPEGTDTYTTVKTVTLPLPTKDGYTFLNWNTQADGNGAARNAGSTYTWSNNTTLYAIWAENVEVSFVSEGSVVDVIASGAGTTNTLPTVTQTTKWLEGWYTAEEGGTKIGNAGEAFTVPDTDTTYYAHWSPKYVVAYNANGGTVSAESAVYEGTALILPAPVNGSKTFEGWFTAAQGGSKIGAAGDSYIPADNIELFAQWSDNILVTFDCNGGTAGTNSDTYDHVTPITLPSATWAGHQFNGWYTAASEGTRIGGAGDAYAPSEAITLHAQWTAFTVSFDGNGATVPASLPAGANGAVTLPTPTRTGYTFNGWYTDVSGGTKIGNGGASYTPTANVTLHAQWSINSYKVTITHSNSTTDVTVNGATVSNGSSVAYNRVVKVVLSYTQSNNLTFTIKQGSTNITRYSDEACTSSTTSTAAGTYFFKMPAGDVTINSSSSGSSCVPSGTMITMADGSMKAVEDLTSDDRVLVFNHETGEFEEQGIIFYEADGVDDYKVINLSFSDGSVTRLIYEHGYFDLDLMQYVYIREDNYTDYIGHRFAKTILTDDGYDIESVTLTDAWITEEHTGSFSFPSVYTLNFIADGFLSMPGGIEGMFNFFDYDENLKYDEAAMAADIAAYGLLDYSFFEEYVSYEEFSAYPAKYLGIALGKGLMTQEQLEYLISRYVVDKR